MSNVKEMPELQVFKTVLYHCLVIILMPVLSFFSSKIFIFDGLFGMNTIPSNVYAAVTAILVLHGALAVFIYRAYFDAPTKTPSKTD